MERRAAMNKERYLLSRAKVLRFVLDSEITKCKSFKGFHNDNSLISRVPEVNILQEYPHILSIACFHNRSQRYYF